jgi:hypothetical protein
MSPPYLLLPDPLLDGLLLEPELEPMPLELGELLLLPEEEPLLDGLLLDGLLLLEPDAPPELLAPLDFIAASHS